MSSQNSDAVLLGGRLITVTLLRVQDSSPQVVAAALDAHLRTAASLAGLPTVLDLEALGPTLGGLELPTLVELLRSRDVSLIGVRDSGEAARSAALAAGLVVVKMDGARPVKPAPERAPDTAIPATAESLRTLTVTQPVRSGQQVYARGGDLVLIAPVSAGAEVMADGNIHAYGRMRGRAVAGVQGDTAARIFCQRLDAELVAIAGYYRLSDQISDAERAGPVQVRLAGESLLIEPL